MEVRIVDFALLIGGWLVGNVVLNAFERHVPWHRRAVKLVLIVLVFLVVGALGGRIAFYTLLAAMGIGIVLLHAWWFPKHGIHGITAEPRVRYLELIGRHAGAVSENTGVDSVKNDSDST